MSNVPAIRFGDRLATKVDRPDELNLPTLWITTRVRPSRSNHGFETLQRIVFETTEQSRQSRDRC